MKKSILLTAASILALNCSPLVHAIAVKTCDGTVNNPCIVMETKEDSGKIKRWRTAAMIREAYKGNTQGLKNLWVSVSGAPNAKAFKAILEKIDAETGGKYKKVIDLDLREESHAYLNHDPITLMSEDNWINKGKTHQQTVADELSWVQALQAKGTLFNVLTDEEYNDGKYSEGVAVPVKEVELEKDVVEKLGFEYDRLTVTDHMRPMDSEIDAFVNLIRNTPEKVWVHMHCRGGNGRATTFFAMFDMLRNADRVSFNDIIKRQASVKPYYDLSDISRKEGDMAKYFLERYNFLKHFYQFANDSLNGYKGSWSQWLADSDRQVSIN